MGDLASGWWICFWYTMLNDSSLTTMAADGGVADGGAGGNGLGTGAGVSGVCAGNQRGDGGESMVWNLCSCPCEE